jgi:hypothetical protein
MSDKPSAPPSAPPSGSVPPAGVPQKSSSGLLWIGLLLLIVGGGGVYLRMQKSGQTTETIPAPVAPPQGESELAKAAAELNEAPPPPPPEETPEAAPTPATEPAKTAAKGGGGCSGNCQGTETPKLLSALQSKAGQARSCYNRALRLNSNLEGKLTASVRVGPTGAPCSVSITADTLNDPGVKSCVTQMFRSSEYPAPQGGCVQVNVPISFVAKQ